jgi:hypothetical protein
MTYLPLIRGFHTVQRIAAVVTAGLLLLFSAHPAQAAETLGQMTNSLYDSFTPVQAFISTISFLLGIWYAYRGVLQLRASGEGGDRAPPLSASLMKLGGGAALISLPFVINVLVRSATGKAVGSGNDINLTGDVSRSFAGPGLDEALGRFVSDFFTPFMNNALPLFCYIAGVILVLRGMQRVANNDDKRPPGGLGTWTMFLVASALMSMGYFMNVLQGSIFGVNELYGNVLLVDNGSPLTAQANNVLWGVFTFLRIIGYITVVRGLFMLKTYSDGGQASLVGVGTHIISGAMLANIGWFIWSVQRTFMGSDTTYDMFQSPT